MTTEYPLNQEDEPIVILSRYHIMKEALIGKKLIMIILSECILP